MPGPSASFSAVVGENASLLLHAGGDDGHGAISREIFDFPGSVRKVMAHFSDGMRPSARKLPLQKAGAVHTCGPSGFFGHAHVAAENRFYERSPSYFMPAVMIAMA